MVGCGFRGVHHRISQLPCPKHSNQHATVARKAQCTDRAPVSLFVRRLHQACGCAPSLVRVPRSRLLRLLGVLRLFLPANLQRGLWPLAPSAYALLGCWVGLGFMLGELPNSCLKRQLDIAPGETPVQTWAKPVCFVLDQVDSIVVALLALSIFVPTPILTSVLILILGAAIHWLFNIVLYLLGVKARPA